MIERIKKVEQFLSESNKIENVHDEGSLKQALYAWEYLKTQKEMNIGVVLKAHKILMLHQDLMPNEKGYFRRCQVWVGGKEGISFFKIREQMKIWCDNVNFKPQYWKSSHVAFERIHPFVDGNGRVGRLLMNWQRLKVGFPILAIKASQRNKYYDWFKEKEA